ncbi:hypothetical protein ABZP36_025144 [Zizania latifolia]
MDSLLARRTMVRTRRARLPVPAPHGVVDRDGAGARTTGRRRRRRLATAMVWALTRAARSDLLAGLRTLPWSPPSRPLFFRETNETAAGHLRRDRLLALLFFDGEERQKPATLPDHLAKASSKQGRTAP